MKKGNVRFVCLFVCFVLFFAYSKHGNAYHTFPESNNQIDGSNSNSAAICVTISYQIRYCSNSNFISQVCCPYRRVCFEFAISEFEHRSVIVHCNVSLGKTQFRHSKEVWKGICIKLYSLSRLAGSPTNLLRTYDNYNKKWCWYRKH